MSSTSRVMIQCKGCDKYFNLDFDSALMAEMEVGGEHIYCVNQEYLCMSCTNLIMLPKALCGNLCEICGKIFNSSQSNLKAILTSHILTHSNDSLYRCVFCGRVFLRPLYLEVHCRIHTGERPYSCQLCPDKFITLHLLYKHREDKHAKVHNIIKQVKERWPADEEKEEGGMDAMIPMVKMEFMIPEVKMEVISDEEVEMGEQYRADLDMGEHSQSEYNIQNPSAMNLLSAIQEHHNFNSSCTVPKTILFEKPVHNFTQHTTNTFRAHQKISTHLDMLPKASSHGIMENISIKSIPPLKYFPMHNSPVKEGLNLLCEMPNLPVVPDFSSDSNASKHCVSKTKLEQQQLYIKQIESSEQINFSELRPEDVTNGLVCIIYEKKKAEKLGLSWAGVAEYFRNIFQVPNLTGKQLSRSIIRVFKLYELKKSQNCLEEYSIVRYYPPSYNENKVSDAKTLFQYGLNLTNVPANLITNKIIWKIFEFMLSGVYENKLWAYFHQCISDMFVWHGPEQIFINSIIEVGTQCNKLVSENDYNKLNSYLNQKYIPPILKKQIGPHEEWGNVDNIGCQNNRSDIVKLEKENDCRSVNTLVETENKCNNFPIKPISNNYTKYELQQTTDFFMNKDFEKGKPPINKSSTCARSYISEELERQWKFNLDEQTSEEREITVSQNICEIEVKDNEDIYESIEKHEKHENKYESIENLLFSNDENELAESYNSKPTIEEYLQLHNNKRVNINDNAKCAHIKDMIFSPEKETVVSRKKNIYSGKSDVELSLVMDGQNQSKSKKIQLPQITEDYKKINDISNTKYILESDSKINAYKRKNSCEEKNHHLESEVKKHSIIASQSQKKTKIDPIHLLPIDFNGVIRNKVNTQNVNSLKLLKGFKYPSLTKDNLTNSVACIIYETMASGEIFEKDHYWNEIANCVGNIFRLPNINKNEVQRSFQQIYESSKELRTDNNKLKVFLDSLYNPPLQEIITAADQILLGDLKEQIKDDINKRKQIKLLEKYEDGYLSSINNESNTMMYDNNNNFEMSEILLPISASLTSENFTNRIVYEIYEKSLALSVSVKRNFWVEVRAVVARISGIDDISIHNVCWEFSKVYERIMRWKNTIIKLNIFLSSIFKFHVIMNFVNKKYSKDLKSLNEIEKSNIKEPQIVKKEEILNKFKKMEMKEPHIENRTIFKNEEQSKYKEKEIYHLNIYEQKDDDDNNYEILESHQQCGNLNKQSEAKTFNTNTLSEDSNPDIMVSLLQDQNEQIEAETVDTSTLSDECRPDIIDSFLQNQDKLSEAKTFNTDTLSEDSYIDNSVLQNQDKQLEPVTYSNDALSEDPHPDINDSELQNHDKLLEAETYNETSKDFCPKIMDSLLQNEFITKESNFKDKMQGQHQEMLDILGLEELTSETFINGVAWKIFKDMKTKRDDPLLSWEKITVFVKNIYKVRNLEKESLQETFEEIFTHCQLLKAKKKVTSLRNYFNTLYTLPMQPTQEYKLH